MNLSGTVGSMWKKLAAVIAGMLVACLLFLAIFWIVPNTINVVSSVETDRKVVALTFDDGPYPPWTNAILDMLAREGVQATFYLAGANLERNMALGRRIIEEGHEVGNHLYNGEPLTYRWPNEAIATFERVDELLREIGAEGPITVRPGRGAGGPAVAWKVWQDDRQQVFASAGANDWLRPGWRSNECPLKLLPCPTQVTGEITAAILADVKPGAIILLHDGYDNATGADRSGTVAAAEIIVKTLKAEGYQFLTVSELLALRNPSGKDRGGSR